jgi:putative ABC transport system permease protein
VHFAPPAIARDLVVRPDLPVLIYTLVLSLLSGLAFSAWPGWRAAGRPVAGEIGGRGTTGDSAGARIRMMLVAAEVALAVVVLIGAALLVTSLARVLRLDPGFEFENGLVVDLVLPEKDYPTLESRVQFFDQAIAHVRGLPGVEDACVINRAPLSGQKGSMTFVADGQKQLVGSLPSTISPGCIALLRIPLRAGHVFSPTEPGSPVLVSQSMGRALFKGADPIGRQIHMGLPNGPLMTVVGVVGNIRHSSLESAYSNQVWMPYTQPAFEPRQLLVRTGVPPTTLAGAIRSRVRELDPKLPMASMKTMADLRAAMVAERRFSMQLLAEFAVVALLLCSLGIYGLLSQIIGHRTREIGVRLALGARPADVVRHVVGGTAAAVAAGAFAGTGAALLLSRLVRRMLFSVSPTEPLVYAAIVCVMMTVALVAAWMPARRAAKLDPLTALRHE